MPIKGEAFYHQRNEDNSFSFQAERLSAALSDKGKFVLYDNYSHFSAKYHHEPIIHPYSDIFVHLDSINVNSRLFFAIHNPVTPANSLANLLYVDLKLKKLFEEHRALQKRSREIMADLNIPYFDILPNPNKQTNLKISSIERQRTKLNEEYMSLKRDVGLLTPYRRSMGSKTSLRNIKNESFLASLNFHEENTREVTNSTSVLNKSSTENNSSDPSPSDASMSDKSKQLSSDNVALPWVFQMAFSIVEYSISHKRETAFYVFVLLFAIYIASSMLSRRN